MQIYGDFQILRLEPLQKFFIIRKKTRVPAVAGPAAFYICGIRTRNTGKLFFQIYPVPVHINRGNGKRDAFLRKALHQIYIFLLCISLIPAPPVSERETRDQRHTAGKAQKITHCRAVIMAINENIKILFFICARRYRAVRIQDKRIGVIQNSGAGSGDDTFSERNGANSAVQRSVCTLQIAGMQIFNFFTAGNGICHPTGFTFHANAVLAGADYQIAVLLFEFKNRRIKIPVPNLLRGAVRKHAVFGIFHSIQSFREHADTDPAVYNRVFFCRFRRKIQ